MGIRENLYSLLEKLPDNVKLVAVTKTRSEAEILDAYGTGHRLFGENKVQELMNKRDNLPSDIQWHMVGHLQSNKVKYIAPYISLIHGVDSLKLLKVINKEGVKNNRVIDCLLQIHIAEEETKFGMSEQEVHELLNSSFTQEMENARLCGLMGMATFTDNREQIRKEFRQLSGLFRKLKDEYFKDEPGFCELSMGMSSDYDIALEEGSTLIRVGSVIFGERMY